MIDLQATEVRLPSFKRTLAYREGWNAGSAMVLPSQNPYPHVSLDSAQSGFWDIAGAYAKDFPKQTNYNLWLSGYADYMASEYNCTAYRRYRAFRKKRSREVLLEADGNRNSLNLFEYADGSSVKIEGNEVQVYSKCQRLFMRAELNELS